MSDHFILAASDDTDADRWVILDRNYNGTWNVFSTATTSLEARVNFLVETLQKHPSADMTFSTRPVAQVRAGLIEDARTVRAAVSGASLYIMAPVGPVHAPSKWGTAWRDPRGGLFAGHRDTRFREQVLADSIRAWFVRENFQSFTPEPLRQRSDTQRVARPGYARELLVRHDWTISALVAEPAPPSQVAASA